MVEKRHKRLEPLPDSHNAPISTDLDWALQSSQASQSTILEMLVHEYYAFMYNLAILLLKDPTISKAVVREVIITVLTKKDRFRWEFGVKAQLFKLIYKKCQKVDSSPTRMLEKHFTEREKNHRTLGLEVTSDEDDTSWQYIDNLPKHERLALFVFYVQDMDMPEVVEVLSMKDERANDLLLAARDSLHSAFIGDNAKNLNDEIHIAQIIRKRWQGITFSNDELQEVVEDIQNYLDQKLDRMRLYKAVQQGIMGGGVIVLIWVIWWLTSISEMMGEPAPTVVKTVVVTQLVQILEPTEKPLETATPFPKTQPLSITSTSSVILERMKNGRYLWDSLWVNGLIIQYGPDGYLGPPRIRRDQVWINQPHSSLVLTGSKDGQVNHAWYSVSGKVYEVNLDTGQPMYYDFHGGELPIYSTLESLIFPTELNVGENELQVRGTGQIADQEVIIADWVEKTGRIKYRLWLDVYTGMVLRILQYGQDPGIVTFEVLITSIEVNNGVRDNALNRQNLSLNFIADEYMEDVHHAKKPNPISPIVEPLPQRTPHPKVNPPLNFDPKESVLKFNWDRPPVGARLQPFLIQNRPADDSGEVIPVDIFADGYYLGYVELNPWSVACDRSPDGRRLTFITNIGEENSKRTPVLGWFDLFDIENIHYSPKEIKPGWGIKFSPDGQKIAFEGCVEQDCGVFLLNIDTLGIEQIFTGIVDRLSWSQNGEYLAWIGVEAGTFETDIYIENLDTGELIIDNEYLPEQEKIPDHPLLNEYGIKFDEQRFGLEACSLPQ